MISKLFIKTEFLFIYLLFTRVGYIVLYFLGGDIQRVPGNLRDLLVLFGQTIPVLEARETSA